MYIDKVAVAIKCAGKVLRESGDTVSLPFGSEYSVLIKNLNSVRVQVNVAIDGQDAAGQLVIGANSSIELERTIRNGNLNGGNRFKFIERTDQIEAHRGVGVEDGLVRVEAWRENVPAFVPVPHYYDQWYPVPRPWYPRVPYRWPFVYGTGLGASGGARQPMARSASLGNIYSNSVNASTSNAQASYTSSGITVAGSQSNQQFHTVSGFPLEPNSTVIVLRLMGRRGDAPIQQPITVETKTNCITCGKVSKSAAAFCDQCGTALVLV